MQDFLDKPSVIPIESFNKQSWIHRTLKPPSLLLPYYSIWLDRNARARANHYGDTHEVMRFNEPIGLSSIAPDECVKSEGFFADFVKFSIEHNVDYVVAWDEPTYVDWPPNTGDPEKDGEMCADIRNYLENDLAEVFTPEGRLKLVKEEIMLVKPKKKR